MGVAAVDEFRLLRRDLHLKCGLGPVVVAGRRLVRRVLRQKCGLGPVVVAGLRVEFLDLELDFAAEIRVSHSAALDLRRCGSLWCQNRPQLRRM